MFAFFGIISSSKFIHCLERWQNKIEPFGTINKADPYDLIVDIDEKEDFNYAKKIKNIHTYWKFLKPNGIYVLENIPERFLYQAYTDIFNLHQQYHFQYWKQFKNSFVMIKQNELE